MEGHHPAFEPHHLAFEPHHLQGEFAMNHPHVTIIVTPRERFSGTETTLDSLYRDTDYPFDLVCVDICSPAPVRTVIQSKAQQYGFTVLNCDRYLSPNQARNVGLQHVLQQGTSQYIVFVENDVIVKRGWLQQLIACAEDTHAAVVGPLTCIGNPLHQVIHNAGGSSYIKVDEKHGRPRRRIKQSAHLTGRAIADVLDQLTRTKCDYVEFHCMLVRTEIFAQTGLLDEGMLATREHIDFCFMVSQVGGEIYSEREAVVTTETLGLESNKKGLMDWFGQLQLPDFKLYDLPYFMLRWSDHWDRASLDHLRQKWNLDEDKYFIKRYAGLGKRRQELLILPLVQRLTLGRGSQRLAAILASLEKFFNHLFFNYYQRRYGNKDASFRRPLHSLSTQ